MSARACICGGPWGPVEDQMPLSITGHLTPLRQGLSVNQEHGWGQQAPAAHLSPPLTFWGLRVCVTVPIFKRFLGIGTQISILACQAPSCQAQSPTPNVAEMVSELRAQIPTTLTCAESASVVLILLLMLQRCSCPAPCHQETRVSVTPSSGKGHGQH